MANDNEVIPVLSGDDSESEGEMLEAEGNENEGGVCRERTPTLKQQLASFREEWQRELKKGVKPEQHGGISKIKSQPENMTSRRGEAQRTRSQRGGVNPTVIHSSESDMDYPILSDNTEEKAKYLFRQGVYNERNGRMYEAVMFYKQAMHLVPDVESRVQESEGNSYAGSGQVSDEDEENNNEVEKISINDAGSQTEDDLDLLTTKLQTMTTNDLRKTCRTNTPQTATHISVLPMEVMLYILRWVVSSDLDLRSLEQVSQVCRGFYVCSRDSELWHKACIRMWGKSLYPMKEYSAWREMYLNRPHPHFNGIYISRVTYIRQGEPSMDSFYRPWHVVEYHRFLRVFSDGSILLVTSADDPQGVVSKMSKQSLICGKMMGSFHIQGDRLVATLEKEQVKEIEGGRRYMRHRQAPALPDAEKTFHLELQISPYMNRPGMKLEWRIYTAHTRYRSTGNETVTDFDMSHQFNSFYFYRVKSYAKTSTKPL